MSQPSIPKNVTAILSGSQILICRPKDSAQELSKTLSALGASCYTLPTLEIIPLDIPEIEKQHILSLDQYDFVIVTSQHAAKIGLSLIDNYWPQFPIRQTWLAIGKKTASILAAENIKLTPPSKDLTSEDLLKLESLQKVSNQKILILKGKGGRDAIAPVLKKRGASVDTIDLYERHCPHYSDNTIQEALINFNANYIVTLSGETLQNLISLCEERNIDLSSKTFIVPSHRVANIAYEHGFKSVLIPDNLNPIDLVKSITNHKKKMN